MELDTSYAGFIKNIMAKAEGDHSSTPVISNDAKDDATGVSTFDIGFGHKIKEKEWDTGEIAGIKFRNDDYSYIPLSETQKIAIAKNDFAEQLKLAKATVNAKDGKNYWATEFDKVDKQWQLPLISLAYNVGGVNAGSSWKSIFKAAKDKDLKSFAKNLRRQDNGKWTEGMDNRAAKELYYAGLITSLDEIRDVLPKVTSQNSGIPDSPQEPKSSINIMTAFNDTFKAFKESETVNNIAETFGNVAESAVSLGKKGVFQEQVHTLEKGESLYKLAKKYGVSVAELKKINNLKDSDLGYLQIGQKIKIK